MFVRILIGQFSVITLPDLAIAAEVASQRPYGALLERGQSGSIFGLEQTGSDWSGLVR